MIPHLSAALTLSSDENNAEQSSNRSDISSDTYLTRTSTTSCEHAKELVHNRETNTEIGELRRQLADRDAEMERLQRRLIEQADEYKSQINSVVDTLKSAIDKVFEDMRIFLGVA
ncbi:hypothetical protein KIN20_000174 [Parelaphostrongylus tenuis]|uniref:Uncharacterized protein n=1 Tax=Parelaphostrongylus tenuis TaxID=148309 RepID=A0AAD5LRS5_PARTN|nr:hypothetical protein KIN20_000174 [Parelaphostrongylus tenuis]